MRAVNPNLNHSWYTEDYLAAFNFAALGRNVRIHRTVCLPDPTTISLGNDVEIGPYCILSGRDIKIGDNVTIHPFCFISDNTEIPSDTVVGPFSGMPSESESQPVKRMKR